MTFEDYSDLYWRRVEMKRLLADWQDAGFSWTNLLYASQRQQEGELAPLSHPEQARPTLSALASEVRENADKLSQNCRELEEIISRQIAVQEEYCARILG
jgi:hypothetical protein